MHKIRSKQVALYNVDTGEGMFAAGDGILPAAAARGLWLLPRNMSESVSERAEGPGNDGNRI